MSALLVAAALGLTGAGLARRDRLGVALLAGGGTAAVTLFVVDLSSWLRVTLAMVSAAGTLALLPSWRGEARAGACLRAAVAPALALAVPALVVIFATAGGDGEQSFRALTIGLPVDAPTRLGLDALLVVVAVLLADGVRSQSDSTGKLGAVLAAAALILAAFRVAWIASMATLPLETAWSEAPALVDALKLAAHLPLYGPPADLNSYAYSPLVDLVDRAVLAPFGLGLELRAHRAVCLAEQALAFAVMAWTVWPSIAHLRNRRALLLALLLTASASNLVAAAIHPDHLVLLCFALAVAVLAAEPRWPRALWWTAIFAVAPIACAAKIPAASLGLGLAAAFALERRWRAAGVATSSLLLAAATLPLLDATEGPYSFYAVRVQASHPIVWGKLASLPEHPATLLAVGAAVVLVIGQRTAPARGANAALRIATMTLVCAAASLPGWLKYAGRDNNLALVAPGALCIACLEAERLASSHGTRGLHPLLIPAAALLGVLHLVPPEWPTIGVERARALDEAALVEDTLRRDLAAGGHPLAPSMAAGWIAAGRHDVPTDRMQSAIELFYGDLPEARLFFEHIEDGRYDTVIVRGAQLRRDATLLGAFQTRLRASLEARYALTGPAGARSVEGSRETLVFERK